VFALPLAIDAWPRLRRGDALSPGYVLLACWVAVYLAVFSLARTKLPSYVTPCYPALALATGCFIDRWTSGAIMGRALWRQLALAVLAGIGLVLAVAIPIAAHQYVPGEEWLGVVGIAACAGGVASWMLLRRERHLAAAATFAGAATIVLTFTFAVVAQRVDRHQAQYELLAAIERHSRDVRVAALGTLEPSWVFYSGRPVKELAASGRAEWLGTFAQIDSNWRPTPALGLDDLAADPDRWLLITTGRQLVDCQDRLPPGFEVLSQVPYFMKNDQLLLLGRRPVELSARESNPDKTSR
jgi:4-amino-4-deoxy-L-arabinose transferase-like glycosyltransferase